MTCMSIRCSCSPMITVLQRRPLLVFPSSSAFPESPPEPALAEATGVSSGQTEGHVLFFLVLCLYTTLFLKKVSHCSSKQVQVLFLYLQASADADIQSFPFTFPLQVVAVGDELQRVCLIWCVDVINIDVQVIGCIQEVIRQQRALTLIQGQVHLRRN